MILKDYTKITDPSQYPDNLFSSAFVICQHQRRYLIGFNNWRKQWEIPAGKREPKDAPTEPVLQTAIRELREETHQIAQHLTLCGIATISDEDKNENRNRAVFAGDVPQPTPFIFHKGDEMDEIQFVPSQSLNTINIDPVDLAIVRQFEKNSKI
ncbi:MAG: NUDIX hydrolase [Furfurilactobacillus sp.]|jgi:8-oxo-dGTP diphosphatase|uniref:NUDIX hydrolase n=2 Tax=Furfurilactobacillus TaxID=2767882 RepID=A0ABT6DA98_9LACO|nr:MULTISPECIES: NUDIX hydrolase [Furfurilactobacillus]QLE65406.1 hypothetical protein LROSL2_0053 [Furfurilactobacillus rossiae]MCF6160904.1 NUDIX hydrolase [Furfurilactobacillus milii]MCF6163330.1 NUDIX hydrolase [Furfurilactobacillus milii]MCH4011924.1 NUDIX hydrolase [Furfurilactobacillus sp.]MCH4037816.1 NUDIX hydrolase [Furfurilactobacillus sp.]